MTSAVWPGFSPKMLFGCDIAPDVHFKCAGYLGIMPDGRIGITF